MERVEDLYLELNTVELKVEFLDEVSQTLAEDTIEANEEVEQEEALEEETTGQETSTAEALLLR